MDKNVLIEDYKDDEFFLKAFESLDPLLEEKWNHITFLRMIWLYLNRHQRREALNKIMNGYKSFCENRKKAGVFHITIVYFWVQIVDYSRLFDQHNKVVVSNFGELLEKNEFLKNDELFLQYYSVNLIFHNTETMNDFTLPDKKPLPSIVAY